MDKRIPIFIILLVICLTPRIICAIFFVEVDGDAYSYIEIITRIKENIAEGKFNIHSIFTIWLPFYQIICALIELLVGAIYYVPRFVSVFAGAWTCMLIYSITRELTNNAIISFLAFLILAINPFHIYYSASSTTDVTNVFFVVLGLFLFLKNKIIPSAISVACAGFTRYESWAFIIVLPFITFFKRKKLSIVVFAIILIPIVLWLAVGQITNNDPFAAFKIRNEYIKDYHKFYPEGYKLNLDHIKKNMLTFFFPSNIIFTFVCMVIFIFIMIVQLRNLEKSILSKIFIVLVFYLSITGFVWFSYITRQQPDLWVRHGLASFVLSTILCAFSIFHLYKFVKLNIAKTILVILLSCVWFYGTIGQFKVGLNIYNLLMQPQIAIANHLKSEFKDKEAIFIYCDEPSIRVLSRIPRKNFVNYADIPDSIIKGKNKDEFIKFLFERGIEYVVYIHCEYSALPKIIPELESGRSTENFDSVIYEKLSEVNAAPRLWLYRLEKITD